MIAQAMAWLQQGAEKWQWQPWYVFLFRKMQAKFDKIRGAGQGRGNPAAFSFKAEVPHQVVGEALQQ